jgi:hypothetical protein
MGTVDPFEGPLIFLINGALHAMYAKDQLVRRFQL